MNMVNEMNEVVMVEMDKEVLGENELFVVFKSVEGDECHLVEFGEENDFNLCRWVENKVDELFDCVRVVGPLPCSLIELNDLYIEFDINHRDVLVVFDVI